MDNKMMDPAKEDRFRYIRVCGKCGHREKYDLHDNSKCGSCGAGVPFRLSRNRRS